MKPLALDGVAHATIVAPHPDDEIIAAFGLIRRLRRRGARVSVIVVTDGGASHPNSAAWPIARLRAARRRESRIALARAGVTAPHVRFLGYPDGGLGAYDARRLRHLARDLGRHAVPDLLVVPVSTDDHPDHRAVARAAALTWRGCARRIGYRVWPRAGHPAPPITYGLALTEKEQAMKRAALRCHRTQTGLIDDDPRGFRMTPAMIARFCRPPERFGAAA